MRRLAWIGRQQHNVGATATADSSRMKVIFGTNNGELGDNTNALFMMLNSERFGPLGITIAVGNSREASSAYRLRRLELAGSSDIPVYMSMGYHAPKQCR